MAEKKLPVAFFSHLHLYSEDEIKIERYQPHLFEFNSIYKKPLNR